MNIIIDICAMLILIFVSYFCYRRGFLKTVASLVFLILAGILATFISDALKEPLYEKIVYPPVFEKLSLYTAEICDEETNESSSINEIFDNYHSNLLTANEFSDIIKSKAEEFTESLKIYLQTHDLPFGIKLSDESLENLTEAIRDTADEGLVSDSADGTDSNSDNDSKVSLNERIADFVIKVAIRPTALRLIGNALFFIIFVLLSVIFGILINVLGIIDRIPVLGFLNRLAGAVLGFLAALALCFLLLAIVRFLASQGIADIGAETLEKSFAVRILSAIAAKAGIA